MKRNINWTLILISLSLVLSLVSLIGLTFVYEDYEQAANILLIVTFSFIALALISGLLTIVLSIIGIFKGERSPIRCSIFTMVVALIFNIFHGIINLLFIFGAFMLGPFLGPLVALSGIYLFLSYGFMGFINFSIICPNLSYILNKIKKNEWEIDLGLIVIFILHFVPFLNIFAAIFLLKRDKEPIIETINFQ